MPNPLLDLAFRIAILEQRLASMVRHGPAAEVNAAEGWVRLNLGEGEDGPLLSPKINYAQMAGGLKLHAPPTVGQNMTIIAPNGDMRQAIAVPMTWSDQNESPSDKADENVLTFGSVRIALTDGGVKVTVGGFSIDITGAGLKALGGKIEHDGKEIGSTHRHRDVEPGAGQSGEPV